MVNHEERREFVPYVHMVMAFNREADKANPPVIRKVVDRSLDEVLRVFRAQLQALGGEWRIHHTVNARDVEAARKYLLKKMIDHPEKACSIDVEWRTALLQRECIYGDKLWMLDVDTKEVRKLLALDKLLPVDFELEKIESPKGFHYILRPFDTREVCKLDYVTLLRDGYYYLETVGGKNDAPVKKS